MCYGIDRGVENAIVIVLAVLVPGYVLLRRWGVTPGRFPTVLMALCCCVVIGGSCTLGGCTSTGWWVVVKAGALLVVLVYVEIARACFRSRHGVPIAVVVKRGD